MPLQEYPRMQFKRASYLCLNGVWDVKITKSKELPTKYFSQVIVPFPIESKLSKVNKELKKGEFIYYRRFFNISKSFNVGRIILHFDGIDQISDVYINGKLVMHHEGGYLPFEVDITNCIKKENERILRQDGLFAIVGLDIKNAKNKLNQKIIKRIIIPSKYKKDILKELSYFCIKKDYVYPELTETIRNYFNVGG